MTAKISDSGAELRGTISTESTATPAATAKEVPVFDEKSFQIIAVSPPHLPIVQKSASSDWALFSQ